ncbi:MAG: Gfo/Idh/MocA family oxidoreductase [Chloroflexia bacterium]|nr:Gfo/Idh/MocA family oxidoreductase [Chloroflexia bacterium]
MAETKRLRVGIIGCGAGVFHLEGYAEEPRAQVVALAGLDTDRCQDLAKRFEIPRVYGDYRELLEQDDIDAVSVVVPNNLHLPVTLAALEAGKHVIVEKPLARNADEGERMVRAAEAHGKVLAVAFQRRHRHDVQIVRRIVANGELGDIYYAKAFWMRRSGIPDLGSWFTSKEAAGGGPLIDLGVHVLDMALHMTGNPTVTAVSAVTYAQLGPQGKGNWPGGRRRSANAGARYEVEDLAVALLRMENGATLHLEASWAVYTGMTDEFGVQLFGSKGGARIHSKDYAQVGTLELYGDVGDTAIDGRPRLQQRLGHGGIVRDFVDAILNGTPVTPSGAEGLDRVRLIDAIYQSAELGREIGIEQEAVVG